MGTSTENWTIKVFPDATTASEAAADAVAETIQARPDAAISVPTGSTPLAMFDILVERYRQQRINFSRVTFYCLDEYVGVTADDPNSLTGWLWKALLHRIDVRPAQVHSLPSTARDLDLAAAEYDEVITLHGGLDLAVLGLGPNGHIGYNEPGSSADSRTRVITLTPESRSQASSYWEGALSIPEQAMTMGVGTLLESKRIVLLVTGDAKSEMLRRALEDPMSEDVPASWLRSAGTRFEVIADTEAASRLTAISRSAELEV